jgi:predicted ferric reductase
MARAMRTTLLVVCLAVVSSGLTLLVWLWIYDGGLTTMTSAAGVFDSLGRITGLLGGYLLVIQVLLLIRLPFLERIAGFDRLTRLHRLVGLSCLYLILAHVVTITIGYAAPTHASLLAEFGRIVANYYGMVAALIGTIGIVVVAVTSFVVMRRRLPYETWYAIHLLAYVGITLTWFHETATGLDFIKNPWAATLWLGIYLLSLQLLLIFRILQPVIRHYAHRLKVLHVVEEGPGVTSLRIGGKHLDWLNAEAGQFFIWRFLTPGRRWQAHPFSLSAAPGDDSLRISAKAAGDFSRELASIPPGTPVVAEGPFGSLTASSRTHERALLIAGGIGITPLRALAETMSGDVILLYRAMSEADVIFREELDDLARHRNLTVHYLVGDHRARENRELLSAEHLRRLVPDIESRDVYLCGPPEMVDAIHKNLRSAGVPTMHIHTERFALG